MTSAQKATWLASFSHFITHGYMTLLPAVLVVIAGEHSMSFLDIGIIANIGYFLYGLGAFPAGWLADRYGSKQLLTVGVFGMAVSSILVGIAPGSWGFAIAYTLLGIFASIHHPAGLSLIARRVERKGSALGFHGVFGNLGLFITPLVAGSSVLLFQSWRAAYLLYGTIGLVFGLIIYFARIEQEPDLAISRLFNRSPAASPTVSAKADYAAGSADSERLDQGIFTIPAALMVLFLGSILSGFIFRGSLTFFPALFQREIYFISSHDEPVVMAAYFTTGILSLGLIGSWFGGWINDKIRRPELVPVLIFLVVTPALYGISRFTDNKLLAVSCLFSLVYYAWQPSQNYLIAKYTRKASHGIGFGVNFFLIFGMGSVATAIGGYFADDFGMDRFYALMAVIAAVSFFVALGVIAVRRYKLALSLKLIKE